MTKILNAVLMFALVFGVTTTANAQLVSTNYKNELRVTLQKIQTEVTQYEHTTDAMLSAYLTLRQTYTATSLGLRSQVNSYLVWSPQSITDSIITTLVSENIYGLRVRNAPDRILAPNLTKLQQLLAQLESARITN